MTKQLTSALTMKIEIVTKFETSHIGHNETTIEAKIVTDTGIEICSGADKDSWPDAKEAPASAKRAVRAALERIMLIRLTPLRPECQGRLLSNAGIKAGAG